MHEWPFQHVWSYLHLNIHEWPFQQCTELPTLKYSKINLIANTNYILSLHKRTQTCKYSHHHHLLLLPLPCLRLCPELHLRREAGEGIAASSRSSSPSTGQKRVATRRRRPRAKLRDWATARIPKFLTLLWRYWKLSRRRPCLNRNSWGTWSMWGRRGRGMRIRRVPQFILGKNV